VLEHLQIFTSTSTWTDMDEN